LAAFIPTQTATSKIILDGQQRPTEAAELAPKTRHIRQRLPFVQILVQEREAQHCVQPILAATSLGTTLIIEALCRVGGIGIHPFPRNRN
jgi:hypothetical protein